MKKVFLATLIAGALGVAGAVLAQSVTVPQVQSVGPTDLFNDVVGGQPKSGNVYARAAQINAVPGYKNLGTITTDPAYTVTSGVQNIFGHAAGTITVVTITLPISPGDGRRVCYWADQTTTTLTWTAGTGATVDSNVHAAGVQYNSNCVTYQASDATWHSAN